MLKSLKDKLSTFSELLTFLWKQKLWWLIPIILIFLFFGIIIIFVGSSPFAPFIYPLF